MQIIVQKYGGTSVATKELRQKVALKVIRAKEEGKIPVVVVSAIGRKGDAYATDTLINLAKMSTEQENDRELDMIMACGEMISSVIMTNTLKDMGHEAVALTGFQAGIITDNNFGNAKIIKVDTVNLMDLLKKGKIPVVTGFQGITNNGDITTLGRGGSDTTAAILGEALAAEVVEIYTDVDGVMTADPRVVAEAKVIDAICYDEIYQMGESGAKVVHPRAVAIAKKGNIPLKVKSTFSDAPGTIINHHNKRDFENMDEGDILTAIAHKNNLAQVTVYVDGGAMESTILMDQLTSNLISIDVINFFVDKKVFVIDGNNVEKVKTILELNKFNYHIMNNCSKVTVIGHKMTGVPGVMARILKALSDENIQILQTSDSHTTISCLVKDVDMEKAVKGLHKEFDLSK